MAINSARRWKGIAFAIPFSIFFTCQLPAQNFDVEILWKDTKAVGIHFPWNPVDFHEEEIQITLAGKETAILGRFEYESPQMSFYPAIPFTFGLSYHIKVGEDLVNEFLVPFPKDIQRSSVMNIYPSSAEIPANLLKIHIQFSQPMQEGRSKEFVHVITDLGDTIPDVFLNLQPELWNADHTVLTLWLDPGRIKRDLQPNLRMGLPLTVGSTYRVVISKSWKDRHGLNLHDDFIREYKVIPDDREKPTVGNWKLILPEAGSTTDVGIHFGEPIDYELALGAVYIVKEDQRIEGTISLENHESKWIFTSGQPWTSGKYEFVVETRLEDLAGNNLNRLFDRDLEKESIQQTDRKTLRIPFNLPVSSTQ